MYSILQYTEAEPIFFFKWSGNGVKEKTRSMTYMCVYGIFFFRCRGIEGPNFKQKHEICFNIGVPVYISSIYLYYSYDFEEILRINCSWLSIFFSQNRYCNKVLQFVTLSIFISLKPIGHSTILILKLCKKLHN